MRTMSVNLPWPELSDAMVTDDVPLYFDSDGSRRQIGVVKRIINRTPEGVTIEVETDEDIDRLNAESIRLAPPTRSIEVE